MNLKVSIRLLTVFFMLQIVSSGLFAAGLGLSHNFSVDGLNQPSDWRLKLEFSHPVSVLEVSKKIQLRLNNNKGSFKIINALNLKDKPQEKSLPPERSIFILAPSKVETASGSVKITISKGFYSADGKNFLPQDMTIDFNTSSSVVMAGFEPYFYEASDKGVFIDISENLKDYRLKKHIRVFPPIGYFKVDRQYHADRHRYKVSGKFLTGRKYRVTINGGLVEGENKLLDNAEFEFTSKGPSPEIAFAADRSVLELRSRQLVPLTFTGIGNFKCQLMRVPAFFGPALESLTAFPEAEERRPTDSNAARLDSDVKNKINSAAAKIDNQMLQMVKQLENLKNLAGKEVPAELANFLSPAFSSDSQAFMGSDDPDRPYYFSLPLDFRPEPEKGGSVIVNVSETDVEAGQTTSRLFQLTDLAITYKFSRNDLLLWVTSIESGKPASDVSVMLINKAGQSIFAGKTSHDGLLKIDQSKEFPAISFKGDMPEITKTAVKISDLIIAAVAGSNDSSFIKLNTNRIYASSVAQSSPDMRLDLSSRGHIFTERGIYKPGETVYWKATSRIFTESGIVPTAGEEVRVVIRSSRDEVIYDENHSFNEFGTCSGSVQVKPFHPLGQYNIRVSKAIDNKTSQAPKIDPAWDLLMNRAPIQNQQTANGNDPEEQEITLTSTGFQVQEFEAPRHFVTIDMSSEKKTVRQIVGRDSEQTYLQCKIKGNYYTGGPVRHAKVQWTAHITERSASVSNFPLFHFGNNDEQKELIESGNSILSKDGELVISLPVSQTVLSGLNSIEVSATVLDIDARPATQVSRYSPEPAFMVGIAKLPDGLTAGQEFPLQVIAVDRNGNKIDRGDVQLEIMRKRWFYTQKRDSEGGIYYNWTSGWVRSQNANQAIKDGAATFDLILADGGDYLLQATYRNGREESRAAMSFVVDYSYSSFEDYNKKTRMRSENEILLMPDKSTAALNDRVRIRYSLPRPCEYALFTRETDGILSARVVKLDKAQGEFIETMTADCKPNVYIGMITPSTRGNFPVYSSQIDSEFPRTYYGFTSIKVQNKVDSLALEIAPDKTGELKALPGEMQKLQFSIKDQQGRPAVAEAAICVVDEAVLSLTGFVTPKLSSLTDFLLPLSVFTGDLRTSLISQELFRLISTRALTGGDFGSGSLASDLEARKDFRPVAFWHPALVTDDKGSIEIEFKLPDTMTSYRIYAVALDKAAAFASAERQLKVTREFYIEPGLPRFLTAGDKAVFPLVLNNKGSQTGMAEIQVAEASNLTATANNTQENLAPFTNSVVKINLEADNGAGTGKLLLAGSFNGLKDAIERELPVNPSATLIHRNLSGNFTGSNAINPEIPDYLGNLSQSDIKGTLQARLNVSPSPWVRLAPSLKNLMRYPYGCLEQTSSGIIPLAALRNLVKDGKLPGFNIVDVDKFLETGINRLLKMQRNSGGFAYWTSEYSESWWATQYAVLALHLAKKSGFPVDEDRISAATGYIRKTLFEQNNDTRFSEGIMALAAVNLAMEKPIPPADLDILRKKFSKIGAESEPLLLWAEALSSTASVDELSARIAKIKPLNNSISRGWHYSSSRQNAFSLLAVISAKGNDKLADELSGMLLRSCRENGYWNSTADTGLALFALAEYFKSRKAQIEDDVEFTLVTASGEKKMNTGKFGITLDLSTEDLLAKDGIKINVAGKTLVNWSLEYSYPDVPDRKEPLNSGFSIEKSFQNINGNNEIRVGDLVKVTLEFEDDFHKDGKYYSMAYLAVEDPIPAGFTAINSAMKNDALPPEARGEDEDAFCDWTNGAYSFYPDHKEFRNDRLMAFKNRFWSGRFRIVYYLRAICEGSFKMKPSQVSLMYNPEVAGMTTATTTVVLPAR